MFCRTSAMVVWMSILDPDPIILLVTTWLFMWRYGQDEFFPFTFACVTDPNITTHVWLLLQSWVWFNFLAASGCISFSTLCSLPRRSLNTPPSLKLKRKVFFATMQWCCVNLALQLYQRGSNWQKRIRNLHQDAIRLMFIRMNNSKAVLALYLQFETLMLSNNHPKATAVYESMSMRYADFAFMVHHWFGLEILARRLWSALWESSFWNVTTSCI